MREAGGGQPNSQTTNRTDFSNGITLTNASVSGGGRGENKKPRVDPGFWQN